MTALAIGIPGLGNPCNLLPGAAGSVCKTVTNPIGAAAGAVGKWAGEDIMQGIASAITHAAVWVLAQVLDFMRHVTTAPVGSSWFVDRYLSVFEQSAIIAALLLLFAAGMAAVKQDITVLSHSAKMVPLWGILSGLGIAFVTGLQWLVTAMEQGMAVSSAGTDTQKLLHGVSDQLAASVTSGAGLNIPIFMVAILSLALLAGGFICFVTWWVLQVGLTLLTFFLPFANSMLILPRAQRLAFVYYEVMAAVEFAPLLVLGGVSLGLAAVANMTGAGGGGLQACLAGIGVLMVAGLMPFLLIKIIPLVNHAAPSMLSHQDMKQAPGVKQASDATGDVVRGKLRGGGGGGGAAAGGGGGAAAGAGAAAGVGAAASVPVAVGASTAGSTVPVMSRSASGGSTPVAQGGSQ